MIKRIIIIIRINKLSSLVLIFIELLLENLLESLIKLVLKL